MKARITNNRQAPFGVERVTGGYVFIQPGETRTVNVANPRGLESATNIDAEIITGLKPPPDSLKGKAAAVGKTDAFSGFLDRSIPAIAADIPDQSAEQLRSILADEKKGKSRKGLIAAIEAELETRSQ